jgi:hypothetical protein
MKTWLCAGVLLALFTAAWGADGPSGAATAPGVLTPEEARRRAAEAAVIPHAKIPLREILTDEVLARTPADAAYFGQFLRDAVKSDVYVSVILVDDTLPDGHRVRQPPMVQLVGPTSVTSDDGAFSRIDVLLKWGTCGRDISGNTIGTMTLVFTATDMMRGHAGVLVLPFEVRVFRDPNNVYTYRDLKLHVEEASLAARAEVPAAGK